MSTLLQRLGIDVPVFQAPLAGGGDTPELVAGVASAGALGFLGCQYLSPDAIVARCRRVRELTDRPFGVNLFAPAPVEPLTEMGAAREALRPYYAEFGLEVPATPPVRPEFEECLDAVLASGASVFSFTCGLLDAEVIARAHHAGMLVLGTATTVAEGVALREQGVDGVIAQGAEAGGHRAMFLEPRGDAAVGLFALVPQLVDAVRLPVIASGAIMDGRGIAAALMLGASAVQMGSAFLWCPESGIAAGYRAALSEARDDSTLVTRAFSGKPARGIANRFIREMEGRPVAGFPLQNELTRPLRDAARRQESGEFQSLWAGQAAGTGRALPAAELVRTLRAELDATKQRWS